MDESIHHVDCARDDAHLGACRDQRGRHLGCTVEERPDSAASPPGFQAVRDAVIIRDPKPTDVLVLRVAEHTTMEQVERIAEVAATIFPCKVAVMSELVTVEAFDGVIA